MGTSDRNIRKRINKNSPKSNAIRHKGYFKFPAVMLNAQDFYTLSPAAIKLLVDIGAQYNGYNNGDLHCARSILKKRNWTSNSQLSKAKKELLEKEWIVETKAGGFGIGPSLYAITWQPVDDCNGKHSLRPTTTPLRSFKEEQP
ncbi:hypothetical protein ACMXYW_04675 [Neptuniibacter sp. QD48_55]|uniref:hypothetical protein n=1 Tax=Neptuniibacter sp. QD48_55 TaxID=3398212 RepID=UPI0039F46694